MIISRKKFEAEVNKRAEEKIAQAQERMWQEDRMRDMYRNISDLEIRLIAVEKKNGIEHPSHNNVKCI